MGVVMSLEFAFEASYTLEKLRCGPLGNTMDGFCDWLLSSGYSRGSIRLIVSHTSHLNQLLESQKKDTTYVLSEKDIDDFFKSYPKYARNRGPLDKHVRRVQWSIHRFVQHLQQVGRFKSHVQQPVFAGILEDYLLWMHDYHHVVPGTLGVRRHSISEYRKWL